MNISFSTEIIPETERLTELFESSDYFPIKDKTDTTRLKRMFEKADIVVTAWDNNVLVGISRSLCDFEYCCYLSDLCVRNNYKGEGIGKSLVAFTKTTAGDQCKLILDSSPNAIDFYKRIGMSNIASAFVIARQY